MYHTQITSKNYVYHSVFTSHVGDNHFGMHPFPNVSNSRSKSIVKLKSVLFSCEYTVIFFKLPKEKPSFLFQLKERF